MAWAEFRDLYQAFTVLRFQSVLQPAPQSKTCISHAPAFLLCGALRVQVGQHPFIDNQQDAVLHCTQLSLEPYQLIER